LTKAIFPFTIEVVELVVLGTVGLELAVEVLFFNGSTVSVWSSFRKGSVVAHTVVIVPVSMIIIASRAAAIVAGMVVICALNFVFLPEEADLFFMDMPTTVYFYILRSSTGIKLLTISVRE
jgi:hypothetical protein